MHPQDYCVITSLHLQRMTDSSSEERNIENAFVPHPSWIEKLKKSIVHHVNKLLKPCGSSEELLEILDQLEYCLSVIIQDYKGLFEVEVKQSKDALIGNVFIRHAVMDVRISAAACISEIFRILAPCDPYEEDQMREFFQIAVCAFESLPCLSGRAYTKSVSILRTISYSQSCVLMLDLQMHDLVHKMFQLFLNGIRTIHSEDIFSDMEHIMTLIIHNNDDCEESAVEVSKILLASLKKEKQNVSPVAFRLAESAFGKCSNDLKPYLSEAGGSLGFPLVDYGEVVVSLYCPATIRSEDMTTATVPEQRATVPEQGATVPEQEVQPQDVPIRAKRTRKPNSLMKYEEGYHTLASCTSMMTNSSCRNKKRKKSGHREKHMICNESHLSTRLEEEPSSAPISQKEDIERKESFSKVPVEENTSANDTVSKDNEGDIIAKNDLENRQESSTKKIKGKSVISEDHTEDIYIKALVPVSKSVSSKGEAPQGKLSNLLPESKNSISKQETTATVPEQKATVPEQEVQPQDVPIRAKRTRKPNSLMKYEEGYHTLASCTSMMTNSSCRNKKRKKSGHREKHMICNESHLSTRLEEEPSSAPIFQKEDIERKESFSKVPVEENTSGNDTVSKDNEGDIIAKNDLENRQESSTKKIKGKSVISEDHTEDIYIKALVPVSKSVSSKGEAPQGKLSNLLPESKNSISKQKTTATVPEQGATVPEQGATVPEQEVQPQDVPIRAKRTRKPNSLMKYEEGYHTLASCTSMMTNSSCRNKKRKKSGHREKHMICNESHLSTRLEEEPSSAPIAQKEDIERKESFSKVPVEENTSGNDTVSKDNEGDIIAKNDLENRQESSTKKIKGKSVISEDHTEDIYIKALVPVSKSVSSKGEGLQGKLSNLLPESKNSISKKEASKVRDTGKCFEDELVGSRVKIWWPLDLMFYEGTIMFFDHSSKKHRVAYDDGETEILDLEVECWELIDEGAED